MDLISFEATGSHSIEKSRIPEIQGVCLRGIEREGERDGGREGGREGRETQRERERDIFGIPLQVGRSSVLL